MMRVLRVREKVGVAPDAPGAVQGHRHQAAQGVRLRVLGQVSG